MPAILRNLKLSDVELLSVVDKGAAGDDEHRPRIVLIKRRKKEPKPEGSPIVRWVLEKLGRVPAKKQEAQAMTLDEVLAVLTDEQRAVVMAALEAAATKQDPEPEPEPEPTPEEKAARAKLPEAVRKQLEAAEEKAKKAAEEAADTRKRLAKVEDERETERFEKRAAKLEMVPMKTAELGAILKAANKGMSEKEFAELEKALTAMNELGKLSPAFQERGSQLDGNETADSEIDAIAKKIQEDSKEEISWAKARTLAVSRNPELYKRQRAEHKDQRAKEVH